MAVYAQPRLRLGACTASMRCPGAEEKPVAARRAHRASSRALARFLVVVAVALAGAACPQAGAGAAMPRISVHGDRLYAGARPWRAWGLNWGIADHEPVIAYFDDPTSANLAVLRTELGTARRMGANSMRIYLQLGQVMETPTRPRQSTLVALQRLLAVARHDQVYLDITGDLDWRPDRVPRWYDEMPWRARWHVQARFWTAVAHAASSSPAVLCYELTSEPTVASTVGYYYGEIGRWWYVQSIATAAGQEAERLARSWTRLMADAVRSQDHRPVSIGLLPVTTGPFAPANVADLLDFLIVHEYPTTGQATAAVSVIRCFALAHKPVLVGETFMLNDDAATERAFLTLSAPYITGVFEFFDGRDPASMQPHSIADAVYQAGLEQFVALRRMLLSA